MGVTVAATVADAVDGHHLTSRVRAAQAFLERLIDRSPSGPARSYSDDAVRLNMMTSRSSAPADAKAIEGKLPMNGSVAAPRPRSRRKSRRVRSSRLRAEEGGVWQAIQVYHRQKVGVARVQTVARDDSSRASAYLCRQAVCTFCSIAVSTTISTSKRALNWLSANTVATPSVSRPNARIGCFTCVEQPRQRFLSLIARFNELRQLGRRGIAVSPDRVTNEPRDDRLAVLLGPKRPMASSSRA